jgi:hypothetical protein
MAPKVTPQVQANWLVTLKGFDIFATKFQGFDDNAQVNDYNDGLSNRTFKMLGPRTLAEMTLMFPFDVVKCKPLVTWWQTYCDGFTDGEIVTVTPVKYCPNIEPSGPTLNLFNVRPVALSGFEVDKTSQAVNELSLRFIADDWKYV